MPSNEAARPIELHSGDAHFSFRPKRLIVAGYTGRDELAVAGHIKELTAAGVPVPEIVPAFWELSPSLLTAEQEIEVPNASTSGEAEAVLLQVAGVWYVAVGSDHTARDLERMDIRSSKAACPKVVSSNVWLLDEVERHWDSLRLRSWVLDEHRRTLYQDELLATLLPPSALIREIGDRLSPELDGAVVFLGTVPLIGGVLRFGRRFGTSLFDRLLGRELLLEYVIGAGGNAVG